MKRKCINIKKIRKSKGSISVSGNCYVKNISHFKFEDLTSDDISVIRSNKISNSILGSKLLMVMKGVNKTKREKGKNLLS